MGPEAVGCPLDAPCRRPRKSSLFWKRCDWLLKLLRQLLQEGRHRGAFPKSHLFKQGKEKLRCPQLNRCQAVQRQVRGQLRPIGDFNHCGQNNTKRNARVNRSKWSRHHRGASLRKSNARVPKVMAATISGAPWRLIGRVVVMDKAFKQLAIAPPWKKAAVDRIWNQLRRCPSCSFRLPRDRCGASNLVGRKRGVPVWCGPLLRRLRAGRNWCFGANN